jgi:hypothetical protein
VCCLRLCLPVRVPSQSLCTAFTAPAHALHTPHRTAPRSRRVFEKLCDDFGSKRRERVVRLDVPLRAFDAPGSGASGSSSSSSSMRGSTARLAPGTFVGPGGTALAAGLEDLAAGLRDSIRAAFEARQTAYDAEARGVGCGLARYHRPMDATDATTHRPGPAAAVNHAYHTLLLHTGAAAAE